MRLYHILTAILMFSLFTVILFSNSVTLLDNINNATGGVPDYMTTEDGKNISQVYGTFDVLTDVSQDVGLMSKKTPGGSEATAPEDSDTTEGSMIKSGLGFMTNFGNMVYTIPKSVLTNVASFLGIRYEFVSVGVTVLFLVAGSILIGSIMKNRF